MDVTIDKNESFGVLDIPQTNNTSGTSFEFVKPPQHAKPPPPQQQRQQLRAAPPPLSTNAQSIPRADLNRTLEEFANPRKLKPIEEIVEDDIPRYGEESENDEASDDASEDGNPDEPYSVDEPVYDEYAREEVMVPSPGFSSLDDEKAHLIFKIHRAKRSGMPVTKNFTMHSDLKEMRAEMTRIDHELSLDASLKFQRKMLMMTVSTFEFLNKRYDPFDLQLNNWSESVMDSIHDYDRVFERLHEKYQSKVAIAPEIELLMMVAGSAMVFHFSNTLFKRALPGISGGGGNPELMSTMMKAMMQAGGGSGGGGGAPQPPTAPATSQPPPPMAPQQQQQQQQAARREMRGPPMDIGGLVGSLGGGAMPFPPMPPPAPSDQPKKRANPMGISAPPSPKKSRLQDDMDSLSSLEDDRLSDVISEDLESIPETEPDDTMRISTVSSRGRGRGRGRGAGTTVKNVITL